MFHKQLSEYLDIEQGSDELFWEYLGNISESLYYLESTFLGDLRDISNQ